MSVAWSTFWQNVTLALIATAILVTYCRIHRRRDRKDIGEINSKLREYMRKLKR